MTVVEFPKKEEEFFDLLVLARFVAVEHLEVADHPPELAQDLRENADAPEEHERAQESRQLVPRMIISKARGRETR